MERRLAAILAADVVGFSRLMGVDEASTLAALQAHRREVLDPEIAARGGRIVKVAGDGILSEFPSVVAAVECAVAIQQSMAERNLGVTRDHRIEFRMGVNVDEVIVDGEDIFGDGVNVAARLENFADPGSVTITGVVFEQVKNRMKVQFRDRGHQRFKNISDPVRVFQFQPSGSIPTREGPTRIPEALPLPEKPSIAVMPFADLGGGSEQNYFAEGLRLDIQAALVHASGLFLIAAATINRYRGSGVSADQAAHEMGVRYVLEGAAQRSGRRIRVNVDLMDVVARRVVWAERYDRVLDDEFGVRDEITAEVLKALDVKLASGEWSLVHSSLHKLEALDRFYRGLGHFYAGTKEDNATARVAFEDVVRLQPESPIGSAYLCFTHWRDAFMGWKVPKDRSLNEAASWAERAVALRGSNGLPEIVLASEHLLNRRHDDALGSCAKAAELRPNCPTAASYLAYVLHYCGRPAEAVAKIHDAIRITPVYPAWYMTLLAAAYRDAGDLELSIQSARRAIELNPRECDARLILCTDHSAAGERDHAETLAREIVALDPDFSLAEYADTQPYRDMEHLRNLLSSLRATGLPA
jgi:class 3 adenylate cyclase/TolB-like protein